MSSRNIIAICQRNILRYSNDCAGFVRAVAGACGVLLIGDANSIVGLLKTGQFLSDGTAAQQAAASGQLVIAGVCAPRHGHVAVVVDGPIRAGKYPYAFWGRYHELAAAGISANVGFTRGHGTLNFAFDADKLDLVQYASFSPVASLLPAHGSEEGHLLHTFT
ncbi:hypothetical protein [Paraburkholderia flagellata]|uniref:hypothetical protein n=1 Tax=Paraburkholderia flagellata TaxID=2883241 RepID=UPI001F15AAE4|nr:hypothetical protein [Paraburkholderia flagellata]